VDPPGQALPDWEIFARVGRALGHAQPFGWSSAAEVHAEYVRTTEGRLCDQTGLSHERLEREGPLQWPVPARGLDGEDHDGTGRLYAGRRFATEDGRARMAPTPHAEPADPPDGEFPLVLTTGRVAHQWHTMTRTGKSKQLLAAEREPFVELHADDAARDAWQQHWIREGFGALEKMIADGSDFCHGGAPTLADAFLIPQVANAQRVKLDLSPFPRIQRIYDACMKLPAFEKAHPKNHPAAAK